MMSRASRLQASPALRDRVESNQIQAMRARAAELGLAGARV